MQGVGTEPLDYREQFNAIVETTRDGILVLDPMGVVLYSNPGAEALFDRPIQELEGAELGVPVIDGETTEIEIVRRGKSAGHALVRVQKTQWRDSQAYLVILTDISERILAESARAEAQREAEEARAQLEALVEAIPDFVVTVDTHGTIEFINRLMPHHKLEDVVGTSWLAFVPPEVHATARTALAQAIESRQVAHFETHSPGPDGEPVWFSSLVGPVCRGGEVTGAVIIARDVTEKRRVEAQLLTSERMASMGSLAAGVAHEINNPLASVVANLDLACHEVAELTARALVSADLGDELRDARDSAARVRAIVRDLKVFSRAEDDQTGPVSVRRTLESTLRMAKNEIRHRAQLVTDYGKVPHVEANESRLGQVFLNLIVNAAQSIPEGRAETNEIRVASRLDPNGKVVVEISDTGCGLSPEALRQCFQPFFTTKPAGVGTGLGLAICARIIDGLGGRIEVDSEEGRGSIFRVFLPATSDTARAASAPAAKSPLPQCIRRGRVLVIDDEPTLGVVVRRILSAEHEVVPVTAAREALERLNAGEDFDVILCDLMMPEMTGVEFYRELERRMPERTERVIFLTGGAFTPQTQQFLDGSGSLRIEKPFDPGQLRALVNDRIR